MSSHSCKDSYLKCQINCREDFGNGNYDIEGGIAEWERRRREIFVLPSKQTNFSGNTFLSQVMLQMVLTLMQSIYFEEKTILKYLEILEIFYSDKYLKSSSLSTTVHLALLLRYASYCGYHETIEKGFGETGPRRRRTQRIRLKPGCFSKS